MHAKKTSLSLLSVMATAVALTACGGGSGGNDPVTLNSVSTGSSEKDVTINPGETFSFTVVANSPDNAITKLNWSLQASAGAPVLVVNNMDCAAAERTDTPRINGLVSSDWKCTISGSAPKLFEKEAVYSFTANAINTKNSTGSASSVLKVKATPSDALIPKVDVEAPAKVVGGTVADLACNATGGVVVAGQPATYTYSWSSSLFEGQQVAFDNRHAQKVKATFPKLSSAVSSMIVTCNAADASGNVGQASAPVEVTQAVPGVTITGTASGTAGSSIALECSVVGDTKNPNYKYKWSSAPVNGDDLTFDSTVRNVVSVTLPNVTKPTNIIATCEVTDEFGAKGQASQAVAVAPLPVAPATPASGV